MSKKPDWKDAPEWAQWLAMDADGSWTWFEHEPYFETKEWLLGLDTPDESRFATIASPKLPEPEETLEPRQ